MSIEPHPGQVEVPAAPQRPTTVRLAALGDMHCKRTSRGVLQPLFSNLADHADVLCLCGDLTDYGLPEEAHLLAKELAPTVKRIPVLAVLGNHDFESGQQAEVASILADAGITMLDGEAVEVLGIGFVGAKGFCGGFGAHALQPWGEGAVKAFVREAVEEAIKLESALAKLRMEQRIAVLHYAPIQETVEGEPPAIFTFLGSSRLEEPLDRYGVGAVFHGHAHHGALEGRTRGGVPVYNVAMPLLARLFPDRPPFRVLEVTVEPPPAGAPAPAG